MAEKEDKNEKLQRIQNALDKARMRQQRVSKAHPKDEPEGQ